MRNRTPIPSTKPTRKATQPASHQARTRKKRMRQQAGCYQAGIAHEIQLIEVAGHPDLLRRS